MLDPRATDPTTPWQATQVDRPVEHIVPGAPTRLRLVVASDVRLLRDGLTSALAMYDGVDVVATAPDAERVVAMLARLHPDVLLLDMALPRALAVVREVTTSASPTRILAFAVDDVDDEVLACVEAGAAGYVPRDASIDDLIAALGRLGRDEAVCSPRTTASLFRRLASLGREQRGAPDLDALTRREREILTLVERDLSNKEIARILGVELATVKNHVHNLLRKLNVARRAEAARRARGA